MDRKKGILNVSASIASRVLLLAAALLVRRLLIRYVGNDVNGLNSLYTSIIGMLAVAELGVGSAISYSMYKPIVEGNKDKIAALYRLYQRAYRIIGGIILTAGLAVMPFLPGVISDYSELTVNVYLTFGLLLVSVVLSYLYGAKTSLIEAYKDNYITTGILTACRLIQYGLQAVVLIAFRSFSLFLVCQIAGTLLAWGMTEIVARKKHGDILALRIRADQDTRREIGKNVRAMMMHHIGGVMVNTVDSVIISAFVGVAMLGKYSNYALIASVMAGTISLFFTPLVSVIGHLCAEGDREKIKRHFECFYFLNYVLGVVFFLGYYALIDQMVRLCFGAGLEVSRTVSFIITLDGFIKFMRKSTLLFRDASGTFYYDRWKPIVEGIVNLGLSLLFVQTFPEEYRVAGVIAATIITSLLICHIVDPYVVYKHVFDQSVKEYWLRNYAYMGLFVIALLMLAYLEADRLIVNGMIALGIVTAILGIVTVVDRAFVRRQLALFTHQLFDTVSRSKRMRK